MVMDREKLYAQGEADPHNKVGPERGRPIRYGGRRRLLRARRRTREDHFCFALLTPVRDWPRFSAKQEEYSIRWLVSNPVGSPPEEEKRESIVELVSLGHCKLDRNLSSL